MAKIMSPLVGQGKGKIGAQVLYRANGEQLIRSKAISVANPRSNAQTIQRMVIANVSKLAAQLRPIINHSFEGVQYGEKSVRFFSSKACATIKAGVVNPVYGTAPVVPGDAPYGSPVNILLSKGSLAAANVGVSAQMSGREAQCYVTLSDCSSQTTFSQLIMALGISSSEQLTFVLGKDVLFDSAYNIEEQFAGIDFAIARVNFRNAVEASVPAFVETSAGSGAYTFNPLILDEDRCDGLEYLVWSEESGSMSLNPFGGDVARCAAVIRSAYVDGAWKRSTTFLTTAWNEFTGGTEDGYTGGWNILSSVVGCFQRTKTVVEDRFLNREKND